LAHCSERTWAPTRHTHSDEWQLRPELVRILGQKLRDASPKVETERADLRMDEEGKYLRVIVVGK